MLQHNGRQGTKGVHISYLPPPLVPPALQLTSWQPWGLWLVMAYCLHPINAWPPLCPERTHINKSNPVSGRVFYHRELASNMGQLAKGWLQKGPAESGCRYLWHWVTLKLRVIITSILVCLQKYLYLQMLLGCRKSTKHARNLEKYNRIHSFSLSITAAMLTTAKYKHARRRKKLTRAV